MNILLNAVSEKGKILLFDDNGTILASQDIIIQGNESSKLIPLFSDFLQLNSVVYESIENIVVVHGPGSFTGIRTICLFVNTLSFIYPHIHITPVSFFELFGTYPIVKKSSKRDLFVQREKSAIIEVMENTAFISYVHEAEIQKIYGDVDLSLENVLLESEIDYENLLGEISFQKNKVIEPLYIKKPNIS